MEVSASLVPCRRPDGDDILFNFLIHDAPSPSSLPVYVKLLRQHGVTNLVRVCGPTYDSELLVKNGVQVHEWVFDDGAPPPQTVMDGWLGVLDGEAERYMQTMATSGTIPPPPTIAVHCLAGLGRAPILVAVALVEYENMAPLDAVGFVRERRNGAINQVQLHWLMEYRPRFQRRFMEAGNLSCTRCVVM